MEALFLLLLAAMLWACAPADETLAEGGIGGTGISSGPINGFGSIIVNGVHFDLSEAEIFAADVAVAEEVLQPGMVVTVYGDMDENGTTGRASRVDFSFDLIAYVDDIATDRLAFVAQGQRVLLDELTVVEGRLLADLTLGDRVYVSGLKNSSGELLARYIGATGIDSSADESNAPVIANADAQANEVSSLTVELTGSVAVLDRLNQQFMLGQQSIDYSLAVFPDMSLVMLQNGASIWLKAYVLGDQVMATEIKLLPTLELAEQDLLLNGLVTAVFIDQFELQGVLVSFDAATQFVDGERSDLLVGAALVVHGRAGDSGVVADELRFKLPGLIHREAVVTTVSTNQITLADLDVTVAATTLMLDNSALSLRRFSVADIGTGDLLKIYGHQTDSGVVLTRLERVDSF